jgi:hypothetical protein
MPPVKFLHYGLRQNRKGENMAAMTETVVRETEIKEAMGVLGLDNWVDDLLDEIELDRRLKISLEQADKGLLRPTKEVVNEILGELKNGKYAKK